MVDMTDFSSLCIDCDTIISAIVSSTGPQPLYRQILLKFINLLTILISTHGMLPPREVCHPFIGTYTPFLNESSTSLPSLQRIFGNVNVMTGLHPLPELNTKPLVKVLKVLKAFKDQLTLTQSTNSPFLFLPPLYPSSPIGVLAPTQMWVPWLQFLFLLPPFQRTPRISAAMQSVIRPPQTRAQKQPPPSARRRPAAMVLPTQPSSALSRTWACSFLANMISGPQISFPGTCPPRYVPTSLVRVTSAPGRTAHTATPGMLAN
jgi:hypothetical protein